MQVKKNERGFNSCERELLVPLGNNKMWTTWPNPKGPDNPDAKTRHRDMNNSPNNIIPGQFTNTALKCGIVLVTNLEINVKSRAQSISFHKEDNNNNNNRNNFIPFILSQASF